MNQQPNPEDRMGMFAALEDFKTKQKAKLDRIEQFPFKQEVLKSSDLAQVFEARGRAGAHFLKEHSKDWKTALSKVEKFLDGLEIWSYKFSTMPGSGSNDPLEVSEMDSIYYMTPTGQSIRLRKVSMEDEEGPERVIEPVYEKSILHPHKTVRV